MVSTALRSRRGASKIGCLLSIALFVGALTYGVRIGRIYWRYYELTEDMKQSARFAQTQSDDVIRRNLMQRVDELGIPPEAKRFAIRRAGPPWRILIRSEYRERLDLPVGPPRYLLFKPRVESGF
jgi:hypothetical protein